MQSCWVEDQEAFVDLVRRMNDDPRMKQAYTQYLASFAAAGGKLFVAFNDVGSESKYGSWDAVRTTYQASSLRWDALLDTQRSAGK